MTLINVIALVGGTVNCVFMVCMIKYAWKQDTLNREEKINITSMLVTCIVIMALVVAYQCDWIWL